VKFVVIGYWSLQRPFVALMFELILSRVADFHIDFRNSYLALPITFLGLALGSLHVHFRPVLIERFDVRRALWVLVGVSFATFFTMFIIFTQVFGVPAAEGFQNYIPLLLTKTVLFIAVFIAPFYYFGRLLTIAYHINRSQIGLIYSSDFFGAALACFATPVLFHFVSLPEVISALLIVLSILVWAFTRTAIVWRIALGIALIAVNYGFHAAISSMEHGIEYLYHAAEKNPPKLVEVTSRWNEFSRVQLIRFEPQGGRKPFYKIIHDNARSNVHVEPYVPGKTREAKILDAMELPFLLGREPKNILVMFAGCGAEMVRINEYTKGQANITGVEINPACRDIALDSPELESFKLREFYDLPNIDLRIAEGRSFLEQNQQKFDMIFVGSSAPTQLAFTGDTRKYMYTEEAMREYLRALAPNGLLLFDHQPTDTTRETLKALFHDDGRDDFEKCAMVLRSSNGANRGSPDLILSPAGFTQEDIQRIANYNPNAKKQLLYAPGFAGSNAKMASAIAAPVVMADRVLDDRPYLLKLDFAGYKVFPSAEQMKDFVYYNSWIRVTSLYALCVIAGIIIVLTAAAPSRRLPPSVLGFLLLTGFCYLVVEIILIARSSFSSSNPSSAWPASSACCSWPAASGA
jgi:SAM-dependent methyltransferase